MINTDIRYCLQMESSEDHIPFFLKQIKKLSEFRKIILDKKGIYVYFKNEVILNSEAFRQRSSSGKNFGVSFPVWKKIVFY